MTTTVRLLAAVGGHKPGATLSTSDAAAQHLIDAEVAEHTDQDQVPESKPRGRRKGAKAGVAEGAESPVGGASPSEGEQTAG